MQPDFYAWLRSGKYRIPLLKVLSNGPHLPSDLARLLSISRSSVSRILSDLSGRGLVVGASSGSRAVAYTITEQGESALQHLSEIEGVKGGG